DEPDAERVARRLLDARERARHRADRGDQSCGHRRASLTFARLGEHGRDCGTAGALWSPSEPSAGATPRMSGVSTDMQERIARNEATFRRINEDIERGRDCDDDTTLVGFVCECGSVDCGRLIELTPAEYEQVR